MSSLLTALNNLPLTCATPRTAHPRTSQDVSELEFQSIFAVTAVLLAGGIAATMVALFHVT